MCIEIKMGDDRLEENVYYTRVGVSKEPSSDITRQLYDIGVQTVRYDAQKGELFLSCETDERIINQAVGFLIKRGLH